MWATQGTLVPGPPERPDREDGCMSVTYRLAQWRGKSCESLAAWIGGRSSSSGRRFRTALTTPTTPTGLASLGR
ncbi:unnamed protein product, partial [Laminaria digitata]